MFEAVMEHGGTTDYCFINTGKDYFVYFCLLYTSPSPRDS